MQRERITLSARLALVVLIAVAMIGSTFLGSLTSVSATGKGSLNSVTTLLGDRDGNHGGHGGDGDNGGRGGNSGDDNDWGNDDGNGGGNGGHDNDWGNDDDTGAGDKDWDDDDTGAGDQDPGSCDPEAFVTFLSNYVLPTLAVTSGSAVEAAVLGAYNKCGDVADPDEKPNHCSEQDASIDGLALAGGSRAYGMHKNCGDKDPDSCDETIASANGAITLGNKDKCEETPTAEPTVEPTQEPTVAPTEEPTQEPTREPTDEPTDEPTETATPPFSFIFDLDIDGSGIVEIDFDLDGASDLVITLDKGVVVDVDIVGVDEDPEDTAAEDA